MTCPPVAVNENPFPERDHSRTSGAATPLPFTSEIFPERVAPKDAAHHSDRANEVSLRIWSRVYRVVLWVAMSRGVESKSGSAEAEAAPAPGSTAKQRKQGDHVKDKSSRESEFQTNFTPGAAPQAPLKHGSKEYDRDLWDTPTMRTLKRALAGWEVPPAGAGLKLGRVLKDDDPRLQPTVKLP